MTKRICLAIDDKIVQRIDAHQLRQSIGRSGVMRVAINAYLEKSEKVENKKEKRGR